MIIPSGPLLSLPFGVLVVERPGYFSRTYYSEVSWMALKYGISVCPSVQSFVNLRNSRPPKATLPFIGFGDFVPHQEGPEKVLKIFNMPESCRDDAAAFASATQERLPNSASELRRVCSALGAPESSLMLGSDFCEATIEKTPLENYRIVYFSTHGLLPSKVKCFREPGLVLSESKGNESDGGLLTTSRVVNLKLDADLVVLSACDTGGPAGQSGGESLSGLARAFFYAGARSLLVTHWELLSMPGGELLSNCFKLLGSKDVTLAEALRRSQTAFIQNPKTSHPMIWGAFSLIGDASRRFEGPKPISN
jgi:CHAT domain-containing protein